MTLRSIRLRNFRRYTDQTLELGPGLNLLEGPNNAGKTTILYAIEYALYGRIGNLQPAGLMSPKTRTVGVELVFDGRDGRTYRLQRIAVRPPRSRSTTHGHFTLKSSHPDEEGEVYVLSSDFDDKEVDLARVLQDVLGVTHRAWDLAVHHKQGTIADILTGSRKLDAVLGVTAAGFVEEELRGMALDREKAAAALPELVARRAETEGRRTELASRLAAVESERGTVASSLEQIALRRAELQPRRAEVEALEASAAQISELRDALTVTTAEKVRLEALPTIDTSIEAAQEGLQSADEALSAAREAERDVLATLGDVTGRLGRLGELDEGTCGHCGQALSAEHLESERTAVSEELERLQVEVQQAGAVVAAAESSRSEAREQLRRAEESQRTRVELEAAESTLAELRRQMAEAQAGVSADALDEKIRDLREALLADEVRIDTESTHLEEHQARLESEHSEVSASIESIQRDVAELSGRIERLRSDAAVAKRFRALSKGFKALQSSLRDGAASQMAERAHAIHAQLAGNSKEIKALAIDPKNYSVQVTPTDIGSKVPAALYQGGGHRQLLGLSVKLALAEHIGPVPFLLLDEPTYGLDAERKAGLLERIGALSVADQVVLITHSGIETPGAHRITVHPDGKRSTLEVR